MRWIQRAWAAGSTRAAFLGAVGLSVVSTISACHRKESASTPGATTPTMMASAEHSRLVPPPMPPPTARFVGRVDASEGAARFAWSGTAVVGRFRGTGISARLHDDGKNVFQVLVDGTPMAIVKTEGGRDTYALASDLPDGVHDVTLYKRTEAKVGEAVFFGFETDGKLMPPPTASERRIEFVGDSITAGYGNEGPGAVCPFNPEQENEYATYGALTARQLGAEHVTVAWSGKTIAQMTDFWERTLPSRDESHWNHATWIPHVVVLNLGTNNFAVYDPGEERFVRVYTHLFERVRAAYPDALIVCALGPMLSDVYPLGRKNLTLARRYMKTTITKLKANGQSNFEFLEFPEQNHADGLGCGFHPSLKTHRLMADRLAAFVKERLQW